MQKDVLYTNNFLRNTFNIKKKLTTIENSFIHNVQKNVFTTFTTYERRLYDVHNVQKTTQEHLQDFFNVRINYLKNLFNLKKNIRQKTEQQTRNLP